MTDFGTFVCDHCRQRFPQGRSDAAAYAEYTEQVQNVPSESREQVVMLCDDCYADFSAWAHENGVMQDEKYVLQPEDLN